MFLNGGMLSLVLLSILLENFVFTTLDYSFINLPEKHLSLYFNSFPGVKESCLSDTSCPYRNFLLNKNYNASLCWGYERWCKDPYKYSSPTCGNSALLGKPSQIETFYAQADFGYIKQQINEMSLMCEPLFKTDSSLECSKYLRFCRGRNIMLNFTHLLDMKEPLRYNTEVLKGGHIGGFCKFYKDRLMNETEHLGALQSWAPELRYFTELGQRPIEDGKCDEIIDKPTFLMKIDASFNMYHHFCDFLNLYLSLHVNASHPSTFTDDVHILIWESYLYQSPFASAFRAFTRHSLWDLHTFKGKVVCFKNLVLPLLPRMIFGLYYNTPIIQDCKKSGLFQAFAEHIIHRLAIPESNQVKSFKIRITFLVRRTKYRRVLNEDALLQEISKDEKYFVRRISFESGISFVEQLEIVRNTDILIGMHGAGLTHLLFLPNWGTIFELYNCEDPNCYKDLARLRGVNYITWEDNAKLTPQDQGHHPKVGAHAKFTNYNFDKNEFVRLVRKASELVENHEEFRQFQSKDSGHDEL